VPLVVSRLLPNNRQRSEGCDNDHTKTGYTLGQWGGKEGVTVPLSLVNLHPFLIAHRVRDMAGTSTLISYIISGSVCTFRSLSGNALDFFSRSTTFVRHLTRINVARRLSDAKLGYTSIEAQGYNGSSQRQIDRPLQSTSPRQSVHGQC
jgi:hypothetical protein